MIIHAFIQKEVVFLNAKWNKKYEERNKIKDKNISKI